MPSEEVEIIENNKFLGRYVKCYPCRELFVEEEVEEHEFEESKWAIFCRVCVETLELNEGK